MVLKGKDALEFHQELSRHEDEARATLLAKAKTEATTRGKEAFDLEKLETMCDTSSEGRVDPLESRQKRYEWMYYVSNPEMMTLKELAELITHLSRW